MKTRDEELVQQIKAVFEDYDDGLSDEGWLELRKKYPEKNHRKLPIWWLSGIAATILVVFGLYFSHVLDTPKVSLVNTVKKQNAIGSENITLDKNAPILTENNISRLKNGVTKAYPNKTTPYYRTNEAQIIVQNDVISTKQSEERPKLVLANSRDTLIQPNNIVQNHNALVAITAVEENKAVTTINNESVAISERDTKPTKLSTEDFLIAQSKLLATHKDHTAKKNTAPKTTIDVFTGTFFNYHDDHEAKLSAGLGLNANIKVTKNVVLSLGAGISQNRVGYENKVPVEVATSMFSAMDKALSAPSSSSYSATATNDVSFNGRIWSVDFPMVVKFYPTHKQDFYISTGINSSSYISQKYTYNYNVSNFGYQSGTIQQKEQKEQTNLKGFDLANSAIIAIGINQDLGKNTLIFEPYYKPAIGTMGDKNLRISSAGLNLKFNFNGGKK